MDERKYTDKQKIDEEHYEALCRMCGTCCGAFSGDPCANLEKTSDGKYRCRSYQTRLGVQHSLSGRPFTCVEIRDVLKFGIPFEGCGYQK